MMRLEQYLQERCNQYVSEFESRDHSAAATKVRLLKGRDAQILNVRASARNLEQSVDRDKESIRYEAHWQYFIKQKDFYYIEEEMEARVAIFAQGKCLSDTEVFTESDEVEMPELELDDMTDVRHYEYDRWKAVQYAERYWKDYNQAYKAFADDCTNFISQCLHAGRVPMWGQPNRSRGFWYSGSSWSYSWTVAHALTMLMQSSKGRLKATQVSTPQELMIGDIICYDFEGDGRINHNTIVTAKDLYDMPLVNAHTYDSRMRYWTYEDSTKYTPQIQYRFYHIEDDA